MCKKVFLALLFFFSGFCLADEVVQIKVSGNKRVAEETVKTLLGVEVKQQVTSDELNEAFKRLMGSKLFTNVELELTSGVLEVVVDENPILRKMTITGNKLLSKAVISKILAYKEDAIFDVKGFESNLAGLRSYYNNSVREGTTIRYTSTPVGDGDVDVKVIIKEAKPVVIRAIKFIGNHEYSDRSLEHVIKSRENSLFRLFGTAHYYSKEKVELDKEMLSDFYHRHGYFDYTLTNFELVEKDNGVVLVFTVSEGSKYSFGRVNVVSEKADINADDFVEKVEIKEGAVFNIEAVRKGVLSLLSALDNEGYAFLNVVPEYHPASEGRVNVTYRIIGSKKYRIRKINITGNTRTLDAIIRREMLLSENDLYQPNKVADSRRRILALGLFSEVHIEEREVDDQNLILNVKVKESSTGYINLGGGYGSDVGFFGNLSFIENNLFGTSDRLIVEFQKSFSGSNYSLGFWKRRIFDTFITGGASVFSKYLNGKANGLYKVFSTGGDVFLGYNITDDLYLNLGYSVSFDKTFDVSEGAPDSIKGNAGTKCISAVSYSLFFNKLDNYSFPSSGYGVRVGNKIAGVGGNVRFLRSDFKIGGFTSIFNQNAVVSLIFRGGNIFGYSGQDVEIANRFFVNDMRGFDSEGIGPRDVETQKGLGGNNFLVGTAEIQIPLRLAVELDIKASLFYEVGTLMGVDGEANYIYDSRGLRSSVGAGLVWNSPFGLLRVDVAKAIIKDTGDKTSAIKFGMVSPF